MQHIVRMLEEIAPIFKTAIDHFRERMIGWQAANRQIDVFPGSGNNAKIPTHRMPVPADAACAKDPIGADPEDRVDLRKNAGRKLL